MKLLNLIWVLVLFFLSLPLCHAMDDRKDRHDPQNIHKGSYENAKEIVSRDLSQALDAVMELKFVLSQFKTQPMGETSGKSKEDAENMLALYYKALCEDFCERVPGQSQASFNEAIQPFENHFRDLAQSEEITDAQIGVAKGLLQKALRK